MKLRHLIHYRHKFLFLVSQVIWAIILEFNLVQYLNFVYFFKYNDFFFPYSWFTVFCQFSTVQHGDPVTHTCIGSFFSHYLAPS